MSLGVDLPARAAAPDLDCLRRPTPRRENILDLQKGQRQAGDSITGWSCNNGLLGTAVVMLALVITYNLITLGDLARTAARLAAGRW